CLLNGSGKRPLSPTRRGYLVLDTMSARSIQEVGDHVQSIQLEHFAPFTIAALERGGTAAMIEWNGAQCSISTDRNSLAPLTSSSFDPDGVREFRLAEFRRHV